jgi:hypothetical protein
MGMISENTTAGIPMIVAWAGGRIRVSMKGDLLRYSVRADELVKSHDIVVFNLDHEEHEVHKVEITMKFSSFFMPFMLFMVKIRLFTKPSELNVKRLQRKRRRCIAMT